MPHWINLSFYQTKDKVGYWNYRSRINLPRRVEEALKDLRLTQPEEQRIDQNLVENQDENQDDNQAENQDMEQDAADLPIEIVHNEIQDDEVDPNANQIEVNHEAIQVVTDLYDAGEDFDRNIFEIVKKQETKPAENGIKRKMSDPELNRNNSGTETDLQALGATGGGVGATGSSNNGLLSPGSDVNGGNPVFSSSWDESNTSFLEKSRKSSTVNENASGAANIPDNNIIGK